MLNDVLIFKKIKDGDIKTFEQVFRQYYLPLYMYSFGIIGCKDAAEEIVQELFYVLWRDREALNIVRSMKSYLYGAVRNQSLQYFEHQYVKERHRENVLSRKLEASETTAQEQIEYKELQNIINRTLEPVSYTHLDVYKRQLYGREWNEELSKRYCNLWIE